MRDTYYTLSHIVRACRSGRESLQRAVLKAEPATTHSHSPLQTLGSANFPGTQKAYSYSLRTFLTFAAVSGAAVEAAFVLLFLSLPQRPSGHTLRRARVLPYDLSGLGGLCRVGGSAVGPEGVGAGT